MLNEYGVSLSPFRKPEKFHRIPFHYRSKSSMEPDISGKDFTVSREKLTPEAYARSIHCDESDVDLRREDIALEQSVCQNE
jgi:hypothetical protein